jgi:hypothetical protein
MNRQGRRGLGVWEWTAIALVVALLAAWFVTFFVILPARMGW